MLLLLNRQIGCFVPEATTDSPITNNGPLFCLQALSLYLRVYTFFSKCKVQMHTVQLLHDKSSARFSSYYPRGPCLLCVCVCNRSTYIHYMHKTFPIFHQTPPPLGEFAIKSSVKRDRQDRVCVCEPSCAVWINRRYYRSGKLSRRGGGGGRKPQWRDRVMGFGFAPPPPPPG